MMVLSSLVWDSGGVRCGDGELFLAAGIPQAADEKRRECQGTNP
jgi:hypothetical protein